MKNIAILGSTGSIGLQGLEIVKAHPGEFNVSGLAAHSNVEKVMQQIIEFQPEMVCMFDEQSGKTLKELLKNQAISTEVVTGMDGLVQVASMDSVDTVLNSVVGMIGLIPTIAAIEKKKTIALANKETLVTAGDFVMSKAKEYGVDILPVDSEHSAIFQCLQGESMKTVRKLMITASGGPFRGLSWEEISHKKSKDALKHPNWSMGSKITIDSATLMNKGLELIEARWIFDIGLENMEVIVHPESIIHSMVEFIDGSVKAQMGVPSMKVPILYALGYPNRLVLEDEALDLIKISALHFEKPDLKAFPCLKLAMEALKTGGSCLSVLNGANEFLVHEYLKDKISFYDISNIIEKALNSHSNIGHPNLEEILEADRWAREFCAKVLS